MAIAQSWQLSSTNTKRPNEEFRILYPIRTAFAVLFLCMLMIGFSSCTPGKESRAGSPCSDPMAVMKAFYDDNDAGRFDASMKYLADDVSFATWATGVNGRQMVLRHLSGKQAVQEFLPRGRGLRRRLPDSPLDGPVYHEKRITVSGNEVKFMLEPDRKRPNGGLYNYFSVDALLDGCRIKSLTVIEQITWL